MDFVKHVMPERSESFFLRFSKVSTLAWAAALIGVAYLSRKVDFVLNAAFALRGLTSGALLGGLALTVFWRKGRAMPVVAAMIVSLCVMAGIQFLPKLESVKEFWQRSFHTQIIEIFWPWYTLIGVIITVGVAWLLNWILPQRVEPISETASAPIETATPIR